MKKYLSVTALFLVLILTALCCVACGGESTIIGEWHYTMDYEKMMRNNASLDGMSGAQLEYAEMLLDIYHGVSSTVVLEINEDETYSISVDKASMDAALGKLRENFKNAFPDMAAAAGYDMSEFEAELEKQGYTMDEYIDKMFSQMDLSSITEGTLSSGKYRYEGEKFYTSDDSGTIDESHYLIISLSGSKLTISDAVGLEGSGLAFSEIYFPMEFTRA